MLFLLINKKNKARKYLRAFSFGEETGSCSAMVL